MNLLSRLGITVVLSALCTLLVMQWLEGSRTHEAYQWDCAIATAIVGLLLLLAARPTTKKIPSPLQNSYEEEPLPVLREELIAEKRAQLRRGHQVHWIVLAMSVGVIGSFFLPPAKVMLPVAARMLPVRIIRTNDTAGASTVKNPATPVRFPSVKLQGFIYRQGNPCAILNGQTYGVGDRIEGATVLAVDEKSVTLSLGGEQRVIRFSQPAIK